MRSTEDRYRTLLDASSTLADQPTVKAVLHSLRDVLSSTSRLHGTELYVLNDHEQSLHVLEFDRDPDAPAFKIGTKVSRIGAASHARHRASALGGCPSDRSASRRRGVAFIRDAEQCSSYAQMPHAAAYLMHLATAEVRG
jgi:hypothetical protein